MGTEALMPVEDFETKLEEANKLLQDEVALWATEIGKMPGEIMEFDVFMIDTYLHALTTFLVEKGIIDDNEFTLWFKYRLLGEMRDIRPEAKQAKLEFLRQQLKAPKMIPPGMRPKLN